MTTTVVGHGESIDAMNITMRYPKADRNSLNDVSLHIAPGEFIAFLGPSGSGKTTLLSIIAGFAQPIEGHVEVGGEPIDDLKPHKRNLGVVFQNYSLFPHLSVFDNVAYPLRQRRLGRKQIEEKTRAALALVKLTDFADRLPSQLSGGQQQRVAFARAVVYEPRALLMDEPLGALDKNLRTEMQQELTRMHRQLGMTFVFVTHDQEEALALADRIAVFNEGGLEQVGTPVELYERPETVFVAKFLGDSNIFEGTVDTEASALVGGSFTLRLAPGDLERASAAAEAALLVRPEALTISRVKPESPNENVRSATVRNAVYAGNRSVVHLEFDDGKAGKASIAASESRKGAVFHEGEEVFVSWEIDRQHLIG